MTVIERFVRFGRGRAQRAWCDCGVAKLCRTRATLTKRRRRLATARTMQMTTTAAMPMPKDEALLRLVVNLLM